LTSFHAFHNARQSVASATVDSDFSAGFSDWGLVELAPPIAPEAFFAMPRFCAGNLAASIHSQFGRWSGVNAARAE